MSRCAGCNDVFANDRGLDQHARLSALVGPCRDAQRIRQEYLPPMLHAEDDDAPPVQFLGDLFGDGASYENDFGNDSDDNSDDNSDDVESVNRLSEPELGPYPGAALHLDDNDAMNLDVDGALNPVDLLTSEEQDGIHNGLFSAPVVEPFPSIYTGRPASERSTTEYSQYKSDVSGSQSPYAPFKHEIDWKVAEWAKTRNAGSTAFSDLLAIPGMVDTLDLSYKTSKELNHLIDTNLPGRPKFERREIEIAGESYDVYYRDIISCVKALWGAQEFSQVLVFGPERQYTNDSKTKRLYHDMHTGEWWWSTQEQLEKDRPGKSATVIPIIISSDKTQVTVFGSKTAYPIYLTIGNIPKEIRRKPSKRAYVLLGYLPTTKLKHIKVKATRRRALGNLFHAAVNMILDPLKDAGIDGLKMTGGDGITRHVHPIFACYIGDYPEQVLVTGIKTGECPCCPVAHNALGDNLPCKFRDLEATLNIFSLAETDHAEFRKQCKAAGIKAIHKPFWEDLPYVNIYRSITPDILHQLYQGVIKHIIKWLIDAVGADEIDSRVKCLPPNHNIRLFHNGISSLNRVTGREHSQISRFILGIIVDLKFPGIPDGPGRLLRALRGILDFLYLAQLPVHSSETLQQMQEGLNMFHAHKDVFIDLEVRLDFLIPKLHYLQHYMTYIKLFGTTDNYNTEYTERLHIDLAKDAYRATNKKDEYPQMTVWLERKEKVLRHANFVAWCIAGEPPAFNNLWKPRDMIQHGKLQLTRNPTVYGVSFDKLVSEYSAIHFRECLARFIVKFNHPEYTKTEVELEVTDFVFNFSKVSTFHRVKFWNSDAQGRIIDTLDSIHVSPAKVDKTGRRSKPARFDTALINTGRGSDMTVKGYNVAQVHVIFTLPKAALTHFPANNTPPKHLAYVEWFTAFTPRPDANHGMYRINRLMKNNVNIASVIPVGNIHRSVHLLPKYGPVVPPSWTSDNVLVLCKQFLLNNRIDRHSFITLY